MYTRRPTKTLYVSRSRNYMNSSKLLTGIDVIPANHPASLMWVHIFIGRSRSTTPQCYFAHFTAVPILDIPGVLKMISLRLQKLIFFHKKNQDLTRRYSSNVQRKQTPVAFTVLKYERAYHNTSPRLPFLKDYHKFLISCLTLPHLPQPKLRPLQLALLPNAIKHKRPVGRSIIQPVQHRPMHRHDFKHGGQIIQNRHMGFIAFYTKHIYYI